MWEEGSVPARKALALQRSAERELNALARTCSAPRKPAERPRVTLPAPGPGCPALVRKLLRRGGLACKARPSQGAGSLIAGFNAAMAKPFRRTVKGKPPAAQGAQPGRVLRHGVLVPCVVDIA
jgi:hypothetical protein